MDIDTGIGIASKQGREPEARMALKPLQRSPFEGNLGLS